jgi:hypothetical protein
MAQFNKNTHQYLGQAQTLFEVVMLADQYGNRVGPANPTGVAVDAFGRGRVSTALTLFDSSHRYKDNGLWSTANTANADVQFSTNEGLINLTLTNGTANAEIIRETTKVMSYQPGKSLLIMNTFVMNAPKTNLRQRVGYFGANNGIFLEQSGNTISFVERSGVTGSVVDTPAPRSTWLYDKLDGTGPSGLTLDLTQAQIFWTDIEWLGVGSVRCGFVINGQLIHCHSFHHANILSSTYITTASLPIRYEIKNVGSVSGGSTLKQICSSVISEGGYELRGAQLSIGTPITTPKNLATAGTYYPVISLQLKATSLDAIVILTALSILGVNSNPCNIAWRVIKGGTLTSPSWNDVTDSSVQYDLSATGISGGKVVASGYIGITNQASQTIDILKEALFKFQLERNGLTSTPESITLAMSASTGSVDALASVDWEEISR